MDEIFLTTDAEYKDAAPVDTVNHIKGILKAYGIETQEKWGDSCVPNCYSLRVSIAGTKAGTNGKGVTREFALASGYGEFMERLQTGNIWRNKMSFDKGVSTADAQCKTVSVNDLLERNGKWYERFSDNLYDATQIRMSPRQIIDQFADQDCTCEGIPYYCPTTDTVEYLPLELVKSVYGSNGGAAGNTMEEAIVQAIGEIVERNHELRVIRDDIPVPEIPEEILQGFPIAYNIIQYLRSHGLRVVVKDCSLGTKFPVVCVCIVEASTGRYYTHFGAHPNFELAVQRTLTETFQGRSLQNIGKYEEFCYSDQEQQNFRHYITEFVLGSSEKKPQFFLTKAEGEYQPCKGFAGRNNRECLKECIDYFRDLGYDVLIRDSSCMGFPTCQVIIPGYSEMIPHRLSAKYHNYRYRTAATRALRNPTAVSSEDLLSLMMHRAESMKNRVYGMEGFLAEAGISALAPENLTEFLMNAALAYAYYTFGKYQDVMGFINRMLKVGDPKHTGYLVCLKRYLAMTVKGFSAEEIRNTLDYFHEENAVSRLYELLEKQQNPFFDLVLRCDMKCGEDCPLRGCCKKPETDKMAWMIVEESKKINQADLSELFANL